MHLSRHNRQLTTKALKRITNLRLSQAFDWWRSQIAVLQDTCARVGHIIARMQNRCVAAAFQSWVEAVAISKEAAARRTQLVDAAVTRSNATILGQMFVVRLSLQCQSRQAEHSAHREAYIVLLKRRAVCVMGCADNSVSACWHRTCLTFTATSHVCASSPTYGHGLIPCWVGYFIVLLPVVVCTQLPIPDDDRLSLYAAISNRLNSIHGTQAWTEQASCQVCMRKEGANKLHRLAMAHLYGSWAPPSTWLHTSSPAPACMAAVMAAWSHALQVHASLYVMLSHGTCHIFTLPLFTSLQSIGSLAFFVSPELSPKSCPLDFQFKHTLTDCLFDSETVRIVVCLGPW